MSKYCNLDIDEDPSPRKVKKKLKEIARLEEQKNLGQKLSKEQEEKILRKDYWRGFIEFDIDTSKINKVKINKKNTKNKSENIDEILKDPTLKRMEEEQSKYLHKKKQVVRKKRQLFKDWFEPQYDKFTIFKNNINSEFNRALKFMELSNPITLSMIQKKNHKLYLKYKSRRNERKLKRLSISCNLLREYYINNEPKIKIHILRLIKSLRIEICRGLIFGKTENPIFRFLQTIHGSKNIRKNILTFYNPFV